ncbi:MAG: DUF6079 family protein [Halanaerobium sp.]|nr:DUF6079 family protein [Halanaerobium sp.]
MLIKDLVKIPAKPRRVINLEEALARHREEIVQTYVLTGKGEAILQKIFHSLRRNTGEGFWLQGPYGSGKSHFLSFLSILLQEQEQFHRFAGFKEYKEGLATKPLVLSFSLTEREDLKSEIFQRLEAAIPRLHLSRDRLVVNNFKEKNLQAIDLEGFSTFLSSYGLTLEKWQNLPPEEAAPPVLQYLKENGFLSLAGLNSELRPGLKEGLEEAVQKLPPPYNGIVVLIDELSHYLLKKREKGELMNELEVLQSLGETVRELPVWVISALQISPVEIETESDELRRELDKVDDRYTRLVLSVSDIGDILNSRIAVKNDNSRARIRELFQMLKNDFPHLVEDYPQEKFISYYPFHQQYVRSLGRLAEYASRERTVILELWQALVERKDSVFTELLTVDILFDRFQEVLLQSRFHEFCRLYEDVFIPVIECNEFQEDRVLARKLVKTLIILQVCHQRGASPIELAHLLMEGLGLPVKSSIVYQEVARIMEKLLILSRGKHLFCTYSQDQKKRVYEVDPIKNYYSVEYEVRSLADSMTDAELHQVIQEIFTEVMGLKSSVVSGREFFLEFKWHHTRRSGSLAFIEPARQQEFFARPVEGIGEVFLGIGFPTKPLDLNVLKEGLQREERKLFWQPQEIDDISAGILKKYYAVKKLLIDRYDDPSTEQEVQKYEQLEVRLADLEKRAYRLIKNVYLGGCLVSASAVSYDLKNYQGLEQLYANAAGNLLDSLYPGFPQLSHLTGRLHTNKLIKEFILEGDREHPTPEMLNIGKALGIIAEKDGSYYLQCEGPYLEKINQILADGRPVSVVEKILPELTGKPYGLTEPLVEVLLATGICKGEWKGKDGKGEMITSNDIGLHMIGSGNQSLSKQVVTIEKGDLLSAEEWYTLTSLLSLVLTEPVGELARNGHNQNLLWKKLLERQEEMKSDLEQAARVLTQLCKAFTRLDLIKEINTPLLQAHSLFDHDYYHAAIDAKEGLTYFMQEIEKIYQDNKGFADGIKQVKRALEFVKRRLDQRLTDAGNYLADCVVPSRGYQQLKLLKTALERKLENICSCIYSPRALEGFLFDYERFRRIYTEGYQTAHNQFHHRVSEFVNELLQMPEYRTLSLLEKIKPIRVAYNLKPIKKYVDNFFPHNCQEVKLEEHLLQQPLCSCGFTLGEQFMAPELDKIKPMLRKGINEYLEQLNNTRRFRKFLERYAEEHPDSKLAPLLAVKPGEVEKMLEMISPELIDEINAALQTTIPIRISYQEIIDQIAGSYPASRVDELVRKFRKALDSKVEQATQEYQEINLERVVLLLEMEANRMEAE